SHQAEHHLNGIVPPSKDCDIKISKTYPLEFCCDKYHHVSTTLEMYRNEKLVNKTENCVYYKEEFPEEKTTFKWKCTFCNTSFEQIKCLFSI
ncbi:hypothetical protein BgiMline_031518, partial [Biomphalaria glabrata]